MPLATPRIPDKGTSADRTSASSLSSRRKPSTVSSSTTKPSSTGAPASRVRSSIDPSSSPSTATPTKRTPLSSSLSSRATATASTRPRPSSTLNTSSTARAATTTKSPASIRSPPSAKVARPTNAPSVRSETSSARPKKPESIPEEPEGLTNAKDADTLSEFSQSTSHADRRSSSPRKIEIRRSQIHSDAELEVRPKTAAPYLHKRSQSALIGHRPTSAPGVSLTEKEQSAREIQIMSHLMKESVARDQIQHELKDARAEIRNLERRNQILMGSLRGFEEGSKIAPKTEADTKTAIDRLKKEHNTKLEALRASNEALKREHLTNVEALKTTLKESTDATKQTHSDELANLRSTHAAALENLKKTHTTELTAIHAELEGQRSSSSKLAGVEYKIRTVETALSEHKKRASENETELTQELQKKDEDRLQLSSIIADLKQEIDKCQVKLDADAAEQRRTTEEAKKVNLDLKEQLTKEKKRAKGLEERLDTNSKELQKRSDQQTRIGELQKELEKREAQHTQVAELQQELEKRGEQQTKVEELQKELEKREEQLIKMEDLQKELEKRGEQQTKVEELQKELERLGEQQTKMDELRKELEKHGEQQIRMEELQKELEKHEAQQAKMEELQEELEKHETQHTRMEELQKELEKHKTQQTKMEQLQKELEKHEAQHTKMEELQKELEEKHGAQQTKMEALQEELEKREEQHTRIEEMQKELDKAKVDAKQSVDDRQKALEAALSHHEQAKQVNNDLQQQLHAEQAKVKDVSGQLEVVTSSMREREQDFEGVITDLKQNIERNIAEKDETNTSHTSKLTEMEAEFTQQLDNLRAGHSEDLERLNKVAGEADKAGQDLRRQLEAFAAFIDEEHQKQRTPSDQTQEHGDKSIEELQAEVDAMQSEQVNQVSPHMTDGVHDVNHMQDLISHLLRMRDANRHLDEAKHGRDIRVLKEKLEEQSLSTAQAHKLTQDLRDDLSKMRDASVEAQKSANESIARIQQLEDQNAQAIGDKDRITSKLNQLKAALQVENERSLRLNADLTSALASKGCIEQELQNTISTSHQQTSDKHDQLLREKQHLEERLGEISIHHNRELEEQSQQHEATLDDRLKELKIVHNRNLQAQARHHETAIADLVAEHAEKLRKATEQRTSTPPRVKAETPLAYTSDEEHAWRSRSSNASPLVTKNRDVKVSTPDHVNATTAPLPRPRPAFNGDDDPFAPRQSNTAEDMTIEGTLESIRVQTQQLLEINDDFLAESRRWSSKKRSSVRNTPVSMAA